jgi:hypothetical protein
MAGKALMRLEATDIARMIDMSAAQTSHGEADIKERLPGDSGVMLGAPAGFPSTRWTS